MRLFSIQSHRLLPLGAILIGLLAAGCDDNPGDGGGPGETEVISQVNVILTPTGGQALTSQIRDPDGNGPQPPLAQTGNLALAAGTAYTGAVTFVNDLEAPPVDITEEVEAEAEAHRVYHVVGGNLAGQVMVDQVDTDNNGLPLGLSFRLTPNGGLASGTTGTLRILLKHYDEEPKTATSNPDDGAETDADVTFNISIQ